MGSTTLGKIRSDRDPTSDILATLLELSPQHKAALHHINGPLLMLGGAGGGKTTLLLHKIAWLIREYGAAAAEIAVVAPTPMAARVMRLRLVDQIDGHRTEGLFISTFNALGLRIISERLPALGLRPGFTLYDRRDSESVIARLLRESVPDVAGTSAAVQREIARYKRQGIAPAIPPESARYSTTELAAFIYGRYEERLAAANAIDIEDLTLKAVQRLTAEPDFRSDWSRRIRYLIVDEYELTTACEHALVKLLALDGTLLTAAGDEDQAITDDDADGLARLKGDLPRLRIIKLEQSYRSSSRILKAARALVAPIRPAAEQSVWEAHEYGPPLRILSARNEEHEAERVVASVLDHKSSHNLDFRHYAVLFRRSEQAAAVERALRTRRIPYYSRGGGTLFEQTEVRDLLGYLKLACNPRDDNAFMRVIKTPRRAIDRASFDRLMQHAAENRTSLFEAVMDPSLANELQQGARTELMQFADTICRLSERAKQTDPSLLLNELLSELRYDEWLRDTCNDLKIAERRLENVQQLVSWLARSTKRDPHADLNAHIARLTREAAFEPEEDELSGDGVALMPVTAAKGLEFRHVYLLGWEEGIFPCAEADSSDELLRRERRLAYLGLTRARDSLTLTIAERRRVGGEIVVRQPSRFLTELASEDVQWLDANHGSASAETQLAGTDCRPGQTDWTKPR